MGVGGRSRRGVLTTCNYEAREFGVRSAMPTYMALQRCPKLIVLPSRFDVYRREAGVIRAILHRAARHHAHRIELRGRRGAVASGGRRVRVGKQQRPTVALTG